MALGARKRVARGEDQRGNRSDLVKSGSKNKYNPQTEGHTVSKNPAGAAKNQGAAVRKLGTQYNHVDPRLPAGWGR